MKLIYLGYKCMRCDELMVEGKAIPPAMVEMGDGKLIEGAWKECAPLVDVLKCPKCGRSYQPSTKPFPV
jgi:hypothetical protein